jgi:hypothetical protein
METWKSQLCFWFKEISWDEEADQLIARLKHLLARFPDGATLSIFKGAENVEYRFVGQAPRSLANLKDEVGQRFPKREPIYASIRIDLPEYLSPYLDSKDFANLRDVSKDDPFERRSIFLRRDGSDLLLEDIYIGSRVFVICNGPSCTDAIRKTLARSRIFTFGMNNGAHAFRPHCWASVDAPHRFMSSIWTDPGILKFTPFGHRTAPLWDSENGSYSPMKVGECPNVAYFLRNERFCSSRWLSEGTFNWGNHAELGGGRSVLVVVLKICYKLGFRTVYLVGCDFKMGKTKEYWFPELRSSAAVDNNTYTYGRLEYYFDSLAPIFERNGFRIYNTNVHSKLKQFPYVPLSEAIEQAAVPVKGSTYGMYSR